MTPKERALAALKAARAIADTAKAANRDLTPAEVETAAAHLKAYEVAKAEHESAEGQKDAQALAVQKSLADIGINLGLGGPVPSSPAAVRHSSSKQAAAARWGTQVRRELEKRASAFGAKALIGGSIDIPSVIADPVLIDGRPTSILDLIPRREKLASSGPFDSAHLGNTFSFLRQSVRSLNAKGVPDNAQKPKSDITFVDDEDRYRVYATITDPIPKRYLDDYRELTEILQKQLGEGLQEQLENDILNGTGVVIPEVVTGGVVTTQGEDPVKGILQTSGIQAQAYATSVLNTLSAARYKLEDSHHTPNAWIMNSADYRALEMMREDGATGALMFGSGRSDIEAILGDYPIVTSSLMTAGSALLGDFTKTELVIREDDHIDVDGSGTLFDRNQVKFREEGRYGFAVLKPSSFITVDLTA